MYRDELDGTDLLDDPWQGSSLKAYTSIPLDPQWRIHTALELRLTRVRIRQVLDKIFRRFLVPLLGDDDVGLPKISSRLGIYAGDSLDKVGFRSLLLRAHTTP